MEIRHTDRRASAGFTLIELIITIMVMGVLLSIGVPAFRDTIRNNRLAAASSEMMTTLAVARSEALQRGINVSVCVRDTNTKCGAGNDWSRGWLVFTDDLAPYGQIDAPTDVVLNVFEGHEVDMTTLSGSTAITFTPVLPMTAQTLSVTKSGCTGTNVREIEITTNRRISVKRKAC